MARDPIPVSLMRGGTSKGVFLRLTNMPSEPAECDALVLALLGSPDPMQLDGLGGTHSSTSKLMAVGTADEARSLGWDVPADAEIVSLFAQVAVDRPLVDWRGNCGNLTAAVPAFALQEELLAASDGIASIVVHNLNTAVRITTRLPVTAGRAREDGEFVMPGVPGTGARIDLTFHDPASALTGRVLPTGNPIDRIVVNGRSLDATILDVTNPVVIVRAQELGLRGTELPAQLNADPGLLETIERIRGRAAALCGLATEQTARETSPAVPRVILVAAPAEHETVAGAAVAASDCDFVVRTSSMGVIHHAFTGTGLLAAAAAAALPGTVFDLIGGARTDGVCLAHPKGVVGLAADVAPGVPQPTVRSVSIARTARRIMTGLAYPRP